MRLKFIQLYNWGDPWEGELINIPESSIFYNIYSYNNSEEWYILIPIKDFNLNFEGKGCAQVTYYLVAGYAIIHLSGITSDNWISVSKEEFEAKFNSIFEEWYVYTYKKGLVAYDPQLDKYIKVSEDILIDVNRLKGLDSDCKVNVTCVELKDRFTLKDANSIVPGVISLNALDNVPDDEDELTDEFRSSGFDRDYVFSTCTADMKLVISKDGSLYKDCFEIVKDKLF